MPRSLILEPTRELADQVAENFEKYGKYHKLGMALLIGGMQIGDQVKALEKGVDVLIATPGRLIDLFGRGKILLNGCGLLVIDEADRMLDIGFIPDIEEICTKLPRTRQTLLFSRDHAGADQEARRPVPDRSQVDRGRASGLDQPADRSADRAGRFAQEARRARRHAAPRRRPQRDHLLQPQDDGARARHQPEARPSQGRPDPGDMEQPERIAELDRFKTDEIDILVASDVAARGLDIKGVSHVFNYDVPWHPDDYVHRIGRTGRAGKTGIAITLVTSADAEAIDNIQKLTGTKIAELGDKPRPVPRTTEPARSARRARPARLASAPRAANPRPRASSPRPRAAAQAARRRAPNRRAKRAPSPSARSPRRRRAASARAGARRGR